MTDPSGNVDGYYAYSGTGSTVTDNDNLLTPFGFAGQYTDTWTTSFNTTSSGLVYMRARWYQPGEDEFTTVDPALQQTDQPYQYAGDDPVNGSDPSGEVPGGSILLPCGVYVCSGSSAAPGQPTSGIGNSGGGGSTSGGGPTNGTGAFEIVGPLGFPGPQCLTGQLAEEIAQNPLAQQLLLLAGTFVTDGLSDAAEGLIADAEEEAEGQLSTTDLLSNLATAAADTVGEGSGAVYGTAVHTAFANLIRGLDDANLSSEITLP